MSCPTCSARALELFLRGITGIELASHRGILSCKHLRRPNPRYFHARASPVLRRPHARWDHAPSARVLRADVSQSALEAAHDLSSNHAEPIRSGSGQTYPKELQYEAIGSEAAKRHESSSARNPTADGARHVLADTVNATDVQPAFLELNPENIDALARRATEATHVRDQQVHTSQKARSKRAGNTSSLSASSEKLTSDEVAKPAEKKVKKEAWQIQKEALSEKFGEEGWAPRKRLSPDALEGIRALHSQYPDKFTTPVLAEQFKVSPEAIRRILKSKWRPSEEEEEDRRRRWDKRGEQIWTKLVELGTKPPKKWREMGVGRAEPGQLPKWKRGRGNSRQTDHDEDIPWDMTPQTDREGPDGESLADRIL